MNFTEIAQALIDTRPYSVAPNKNKLLVDVNQIESAQSAEQAKLAQESLNILTRQMLAQNHYLSLSVALSMVSSAKQYRILWDGLCKALTETEEDKVQFLAWPIVLVVGSDQEGYLSTQVPITQITELFAKDFSTPLFKEMTWLPNLISAEDLSTISASQWFHAQQGLENSQKLIQDLLQPDIHIDSGQQVILVYALSYGQATISQLAGLALKDLALPLMQVWHNSLQQEGMTIFINPLNADIPARAQLMGNQMCKRMSCDVFTTNAIRSIRLQSPRVGVIIASREGGFLEFAFETVDSTIEIPTLQFSWYLSPEEEIAEVVQNFIELLIECHIEHIRILREPLFKNESMPNYQESVDKNSFNPLLSDTP